MHTWLEDNGIDVSKEVSRNSAGDWISLRLPVSIIESMLDAKYHVYQHVHTGKHITRTLSYSLPQILHEHIDLIEPTTVFDNLHEMRATYHLTDKTESDLEVPRKDKEEHSFVTGPAGQNISASCNTTVTPSCLMQLYRTEGYVPRAAHKGNSIGVTGYLEQVSKRSRSTTFFGYSTLIDDLSL